MNYTKALIHFRVALRRNAKAAAPVMQLETFEALRQWKTEMRAYDAARIELGIATPGKVQTENAAVHVPRGGGRIVHYPEHVVPDQRVPG